MKKAIYLFCIARLDLLPPLAGKKGVDGTEELFVEEFDGLTAVVCEVPLEEFAGSSAEARLGDLAWVGPRAVRHAQVVAEVMKYSPVLPASFGTLFSSLEALGRLVQVNRAEIANFLASIEDKEEWAVKGFLSRSKATEAIASRSLAEQREALKSMSQGLRYFKEKQIRAEAERRLNAWLKEVSSRVADALTGCSVKWRKRDIVHQTGEGSGEETVLNWAFLVKRSSLPAFRGRITRANSDLRDQGLSFSSSGPWPPYSFCPTFRAEPGT